MADLTPEARAQIAARVEAATARPPKCHLCGDEMTPQRQTIGEVEFACPGRRPDGEWKPGRTPADQHYDASRRSRSLVCADPEEVALLLADRAELEAALGDARERLVAAEADVHRFRSEARSLMDERGIDWPAHDLALAEKGHPSYVPQGIAIECMRRLELAGMGKPGRPNTLLAMVGEAVARLEAVAEVRRLLLDKAFDLAEYVATVEAPMDAAEGDRLAKRAQEIEHAADLLGKALEG